MYGMISSVVILGIDSKLNTEITLLYKSFAVLLAILSITYVITYAMSVREKENET